MKMRPNLVAGVAAAAALALSACGVAGGTSGGTQGGHAASVPARHARMDMQVTELKDLAEMKRVSSWQTAEHVFGTSAWGVLCGETGEQGTGPLG